MLQMVDDCTNLILEDVYLFKSRFRFANNVGGFNSGQMGLTRDMWVKPMRGGLNLAEVG